MLRWRSGWGTLEGRVGEKPGNCHSQTWGHELGVSESSDLQGWGWLEHTTLKQLSNNFGIVPCGVKWRLVLMKTNFGVWLLEGDTLEWLVATTHFVFLKAWFLFANAKKVQLCVAFLSGENKMVRCKKIYIMNATISVQVFLKNVSINVHD